MTTKYPITVSISTPDGDGEANKRAAGEPWRVATPTRDFSFYGTVTAMETELTRCLRDDYPDEAAPVTFHQ